jgi:Spy/CpxP family protein refolding chaperone
MHISTEESMRSSRRFLIEPLARLRLARHTRTFAALAIALACSTSALAAQGGRRRSAAPDESAPAREKVDPTLWEPEQIFPLAIAHASELKLSDDQRGQIETIASKLRASNAPLLEAIDTLRPPRIQLPDPNNPSAPTATPPQPSPDSIAAIVARRHALGEARAQLHENIRLARDQMNQLMTPEQQTRLQALETSARNSAERGDPGGSSGVGGVGGAPQRSGRRGSGYGPPRE